MHWSYLRRSQKWEALEKNGVDFGSRVACLVQVLDECLGWCPLRLRHRRHDDVESEVAEVCIIRQRLGLILEELSKRYYASNNVKRLPSDPTCGKESAQRTYCC